MITGTDSDFLEKKELVGPSRHFTYVFNSFVMMTVFNFLNARKIKDELKFYQGLLSNYLFLIIVFFIFFAQSIIVTHGSVPFRCYNHDRGLTIE